MLHAVAFALSTAQPNRTKPISACETASRPCHSVTVAINADNKLFLSGKSVAPTALRGDFRALAKRYPHAYVSIEADAKASYGTVVRVLDTAKNAGLKVNFSPR